MMPGESKRKWYDRQFAQMKNDRSTWETAWQELGDYILPKRVRIASPQSEHNDGRRRNQRIVEPTATFSARTLGAGLLAGTSNPSRPWFRFTVPDKDLAEFGPVKTWISDTEARVRDILLRSNVYKVLPTMYQDFGVFGNAAGTLLEDGDDVVRLYAHPIGTFYWSLNERMQIDTQARTMMLTVRQMAAWFGVDRLSLAAKNCYDRGEYQQTFEVTHFIHPNPDAKPGRLEAKFLPFASCYYETAAEGDKLLRESGFHENPIIAPRWDVSGENIYGIGPGTDAIPEVKELQALRKKKSRGLDKMLDPPMVGNPALKQSTPNLLPGGVTYVEERDGKPAFRPAHEVNYPLQHANEDIRERQFMIRRAMYEDLFLMLATSDRREITAREIDERHEEKLLALGPALSNLDHDGFDPMITRVFNIANRAGLLPPPPEEIQGVDLKVEYISIMAQAQKMVALGGIDRLLTVATTLEKFKPGSMDKVDTDQAIDELGDILGVPARIIRPDEQVAAIRDERVKAAEAEAKAAQMQAMAGAAKDLAAADTSGQNALTDLAGAARQAQGAPA